MRDWVLLECANSLLDWSENVNLPGGFTVQLRLRNFVETIAVTYGNGPMTFEPADWCV